MEGKSFAENPEMELLSRFCQSTKFDMSESISYSDRGNFPLYYYHMAVESDSNRMNSQNKRKLLF